MPKHVSEKLEKNSPQSHDGMSTTLQLTYGKDHILWYTILKTGKADTICPLR